MDQGRGVKKIFESKLEVSRKGEDLHSDGWKTQEDRRELKVKRWRQKAVDSEE